MKQKQFLSVIIIYLHTVKVKSTNGQINLLNKEAPQQNQSKIKQGSTTKVSCNEDQLMLYLAEIQVINPENIINLATFEHINSLCSKVFHSLSVMDNYLKTCDPPQENDLYIQLIKGVDALYEKLCTEGKFKTAFKEQYKCLHDLHNDFQDCNGPADWNEDNDKAKVCKVYHDIADCYYTKAAQLCGVKAAAVMKELIVAIINSVIVIKCDKIKTNPVVPDAMPVLDKKNKSHVPLIALAFKMYIYVSVIYHLLLLLQL